MPERKREVYVDYETGVLGYGLTYNVYWYEHSTTMHTGL